MTDSLEHFDDDGDPPGRFGWVRNSLGPQCDGNIPSARLRDDEAFLRDQGALRGRLRDQKGMLSRLRSEENGLSTAEYAVGTVAVVGLGGLLIKLLTSNWFFGLLQGIFEGALTSVF